MKARMLVLAACALAGGCASGGPPPPPRAMINIFISPAGEPFRAGPTAAYPLEVWFARADADHDGAISLPEFEADERGFFQRIDANHDGVVDGFELVDYEQKIAPEILPRVGRLTAADMPALPGTAHSEHQLAEMQKPVRRRGGSGVNGAGMFSLLGAPEPVASADADLDGKVTLAEALAASRRQFVSLDLDHDGRLRRTELPTTPAEKLAARAARAEQDRSR